MPPPLWTLLLCLPLVLCADNLAVNQKSQETIDLAHKIWTNASQSNWKSGDAIRGVRRLLEPLRQLPRPDVFNGMEMLYGWARVQAKAHGIESMFETFVNFVEQDRSAPQSERAWLDMAQGMLQDVETLPEIHRRIVANQTVYSAGLKEDTKPCYAGQSKQMQLYNMYAANQITFLKAYVMAQSAWLITDAQDRGHFWSDAANMTEMYQNWCREIATAAKNYIQRADRSFWKCDPRRHVEGKTYETVKGLLQGYLENEIDMNSGQTCRGGCQNYQVAESMSCYQDKFCSVQPTCTGRIFDCRFIEADMKVCMPANSSSRRRYEYISYKKGTLLGSARLAEECNTVSVDSWWRFFLPAHCTYCFCQCEESPDKSERYFSLGWAQADTDNNNVVTGVRFVKQGRTFYIQVQQGALLPGGNVNQSTVQWVPLNTSAERFLMSYEQRIVDLDDLQAPPGYVLTGMRFRAMGSHLNPEIMVTPLELELGLLHRPSELSYWHGNDNTEHSLPPYARTSLQLPTADVDMNRGQNEPDSRPNSFVHFGPSSFNSDAAQTTIPLIDIQPVVPTSPTILSGAGIYHKGCDYMAGFVAPRIFTYDFSQHIQS